MAHHTVISEIAAILDNDGLSTNEKIESLKRMREGARAEMRAATESAMVDDSDVGDDLKLIDEALNDLAAHPDSIEDGGGATL